MRKRLAIVAAVALVAFAFSTGTALAAPKIVAYGSTNPVAWGLKSMLTTRFWVKSDTAGAWCVIEVLGAKGVVKRVWSGALTRANTRYDSPRWDGRDASGKRLPTATYRYRITVSRGGTSTSVTSPIIVAKSYFAISGKGSNHYDRYFYAGAWSPTPRSRPPRCPRKRA